jgi:hypothetical protein
MFRTIQMVRSLHQGGSLWLTKEMSPPPLKYPMVDLFTGGLIMPLMYVNALAAWYLMSLNAPRLFTEAWMKALESQREQNRQV